jgi:hypothetical protein
MLSKCFRIAEHSHGSEANGFTAPSAHEVATGGTEPIDSAKIQPLEPTKQ